MRKGEVKKICKWGEEKGLKGGRIEGRGKETSQIMYGTNSL